MASSSKQVTVKLVVDGTDLDVKMTKAQLKVVQASSDMGAALANLARASKTSLNDAARSAEKLGDAAHAQVTKVQALGGAIRGLDGSLNVRAAERFLASFGAISKLATLAFPVFGLLAVGDVLVNLGKHAYEAYQALKQMSEAPQRIAAAFRGIDDPIRQSNDDLAVANDRLQIEIDKLSGRPSNSLKLALDEAVASADKLASSLDKDLTALNKLLQENSVPWYSQLLGKAGTGALKDEIGGDNGLGGFAGRVTAINDAGGDKIRAARDAGQSTDAATKDLNNKLAAAYKDEINRLGKILADAQSPKSITTINRAGRQITSEVDPATQSDLIATTQGAIRNVKDQYDKIIGTATNDTLTKKKDELSSAASAESLTRPFEDKTKELAAQIDGLRDKLKSVGTDGTAEVMAKAYGDWKEALVKLNNELGKHHTKLTAAQSDQLKSQFVTIETTKAEIEWQESLKKSTASIDEKTRSLLAQTSVIGQGYAAQKAYNVEAELATKLGSRANDPAWIQAHASDVSGLRSSLGTQYDAAQSEKTAQTLDQLQEQISLETVLANAEGKGSEAVREATLQHELQKIAEDNSTASAQQLIAATAELAAAQEKVKAASTIATLEQEIAATERLTSAQLAGAAAIRDAQLANRLDQIKRSTPAGPQQDAEITLARQQTAAQHQLEIASAAIRTGNEYKDQLQSLDEQISYLQTQKELGNDSLAIETSLLDLEKQRAKTYAEMLDQTDSALNGLKAWFAELQAGGETVAQLISGTLKSAISGANDQLAKLLTDGKTDWRKSFQSIAETGTKNALGVAESSLAKGVGSKGGIGGILGGILTGKSGGKPDGSKSNPLYVSMIGSSGAAKSGGDLLGGLIGGDKPELGGSANIDKADVDNLGDFGGDELKQLAGGSGSSSGLGGLLSGLLGKLTTGASSGGGSGLSGFGGILSGLFGKLAGHFAEGGDTTVPGNYLVGEKGPEVLSLGGGAHVTPNNKLGDMSGGHTINYNIDASGSTDAAGTELRVRNAIAASHRKSVQEATLTVNELSKRRPRG